MARGLKEAVVIDVVRSAIGKSGWKGMEKRGQLCEASAQDLLAEVIRGLIERVKARSDKFREEEIEDVLVGCLSQVGEQGLNIGRISTLIAQLPVGVAGMTINRYCNAGLQAINSAAQAIMTGCGEIMISAGVELMSHYPMGSCVRSALDAKYPVRMSKRLRPDALIPMGMAAELIAEEYKLKREELDQFGLWSQQKAVRAEREGKFADHIIPFEYEVEGKKVRVEKDETLRPECLDDPEKAMEKIRKLPPRFKENGVVTAANSSQIVDGAGAALLMSADKAEELGLEPMVRIVSMAVAGDDPRLQLMAPVPAMKKALARAGKTIDDMDIIEPNEAFASPVLAYCKEFGLAFDDPRINPTGGAIALGHPIGATGVIFFGEMVWEMKRRNLRWGIQTLCGGGGVGIATVVERV